MLFHYMQSVIIQQSIVRNRQPAARLSLKQIIPPSFLFITLMLHLWIRLGIVETAYQLETIRAQALKNDNEIRQRKLQLAYVSRPTLLFEQAESRLGLKKTSPSAIRKIEQQKD